MLQNQNDVPLGQVTIRQWEITSNSTRYERLQAAPSDEGLHTIWTSWVIISAFITVLVAIVLIALGCDEKARRNPFNLYLVYLMIPDVLFSAFCALSCALNVTKGSYWSTHACQFQSFYLVWGVAANSWLNLAIARQVHTLLQSSVVRRKYQIPSLQHVTYTAIAVYVYAAFLASWGLWGSRVAWWPQETVSISGLGCYPLEYSVASSWFFFLVFIPCLAGIPLLYVVYICWNIYHRQLLPPAGKRRLLSLYFLRIVAAYVIMWMPYIILCFAGFGNPWMVFAGGTWGHFQGALSALVSLTKPDIQAAVMRFVTCSSSDKDSIRNNNSTMTTARVHHSPGSTPCETDSTLSLNLSGHLKRLRLQSFDSFIPNQPLPHHVSSTVGESTFSSQQFWPATCTTNTVQESPCHFTQTQHEHEQAPNVPTCRNMTPEQPPIVDDFLPQQQDDFTYADEQITLQEEADDEEMN